MRDDNMPIDEQSARQEALDFARAEREARRVSSAQKSAQATDAAAARRAAAQPQTARKRSAQPAAKAAQPQPSAARTQSPRQTRNSSAQREQNNNAAQRPAAQRTQSTAAQRPAAQRTQSTTTQRPAAQRTQSATTQRPAAQRTQNTTTQRPAAQQTKSGAAQRPAAQPAPKRKGSRVWIVAVAVIAVLCVALLVGAFLVAARDTVFPNVTVNGTDVAGMTESEAAEAIRAAGWENADATVLTVTFPGDATFAVTAGDTGFTSTAEEAATAAWNYGREGNLITNFFTYLHCAISGEELADTLSTGVDEAALRERITAEIGELNLSLSEGNMEVDEDASVLKVVKGGTLITIDPEDVLQTVLDALSKHQYGTVAYQVQSEEQAAAVSMQELHDAVCTGPVNAAYDTETKTVTESKPGVEFDVDEAQRLWDAAALGDTVTIPVTLTQPDLKSSDVTGLYTDKLATKTTSLSGSSYNRINNVKLAAQKINGVVLEPGESFSYNDVVGQRTKANGFLEAGAYANGQVVQEVGGGICQVSSTLYYCTLISNLKITARSCHYFTVSYIEPGMDATVSWGGPEFKFVNNRSFPIKITSSVSNGSLTVEIWGTDVDGSYVEMSYAVSGMTATTYRSVYNKDGTLQSKTQEATSTYHSHETTTTTPSAKPSATPTPTTTPAQTPAATPTPAETAAPTVQPSAAPAEPTTAAAEP